MKEKLAGIFKIEGITKRWVINTLGIIFAVFFFAVIISGFAVHKYYYGLAERAFENRGNGNMTIYSSLYSEDNGRKFEAAAAGFTERFRDKSKMEVWVINAAGKVVSSSSGFQPEPNPNMPDYVSAQKSENGEATWIGRLSSGEKVMAYTVLVPSDKTGQTVAVRYIVSLEAIDAQILTLIVLIILVVLIALTVVVLSNVFFIQSVVIPVREVGETAKRIAAGDFNARINKKYDDEIGALCDTINYMAGEIATADRMKNDFISTVSHELRTPLTAIKGWGETLISDTESDPVMTHRGLQVIINESGRLSGFVEELLDFSRMQSGRMTMRFDTIDLLAELDEAVFVFKERAHREGIEVAYNVPDLLAPAKADANRIKQVFVNILDNAIKYNHEGGKVFVSAQFDNATLNISFADTGCGIAKKDLPRIKEKFYKANISVRGSGIGLAVADEIITMHGGTLEVESEQGVGTTVYITLHLLSAPQPMVPPAELERKEAADE